MTGRWDDCRNDIFFAIRDGHGVSITGRSEMVEATKHGSTAYMGEFKDGFYKCQNKADTKANFDACCAEDERRVYNFGREALGLPGI